MRFWWAEVYSRLRQGHRRAVKLTDIILPLKNGRSSREPPLIRGTLQHLHTTKKHPYWDAFLWWSKSNLNRTVYSLLISLDSLGFVFCSILSSVCLIFFSSLFCSAIFSSNSSASLFTEKNVA